MTPTRVPVLLISGAVGAGTTTIAGVIGELLREAGVPHAIVDLAVIGQCWPPPADDPWNERLIHRNLAIMWGQFRQAGAQRLVLSRVLEDRSLLRPGGEAVPGAEITVVHLRVTLPMLHARLRRREAADPAWYLDAATRRVDVAGRVGRPCGGQQRTAVPGGGGRDPAPCRLAARPAPGFAASVIAAGRIPNG